MKFVADENVFKHTVLQLRAEGHEVYYIAEERRRSPDRSILGLALREGAIVLTYDKDYRYHLIEEKQASLGVVWVRRQTRRADVAAETERIIQAVRQYGEQLYHHLTVVYPDRIEQFPLPRDEEEGQGLKDG